MEKCGPEKSGLQPFIASMRAELGSAVKAGDDLKAGFAHLFLSGALHALDPDSFEVGPPTQHGFHSLPGVCQMPQGNQQGGLALGHHSCGACLWGGTSVHGAEAGSAVFVDLTDIARHTHTKPMRTRHKLALQGEGGGRGA